MVIALDKRKKPVGFVTEKRARQLMTARRACTYKMFPFTIILKDIDVRDLKDVPSYRIKIDPGASHTGIAIVENGTNRVMYYMQIHHRGQQIVSALLKRKQARRNRRNRETWYRRCKFPKKGMKAENTRLEGKLPPSIQSIVDNVINMVDKLCKLINITECSFEAVRFDTQLMDNHDIEGKEYQQGTLYGYEIKEYLLDKYRHTCQYCGGESGDNILEWEHKIPSSRGGSDSVKNATLACRTCNAEKDNLTPEEWLEKLRGKRKLTKLNEARIENIEKVIKGTKVGGSNRYCAWASSTRKAEERELFRRFDTVECASGGKTKFNRTALGFPKDHHYDALCVGDVPEGGYVDSTNGYVLDAKAIGRGSRLRGTCNSCGIITVKWKNRSKRKFGFQSKDMCLLDKPDGKNCGTYVGRVSVRSTGYFDLYTFDRKVVNANYEYFKKLQPADGYEWRTRCAIPLGHE